VSASLEELREEWRDPYGCQDNSTACDYISALESELVKANSFAAQGAENQSLRVAELEKEMNWINCKDRLPEPLTYVLLLADRYWNTPEGVPDMKVAAVGYLENRHGTYWSVFGERGMNIEAFTHWLPIPEEEEE
jgi:hypothetical protein